MSELRESVIVFSSPLRRVIGLEPFEDFVPVITLPPPSVQESHPRIYDNLDLRDRESRSSSRVGAEENDAITMPL